MVKLIFPRIKVNASVRIIFPSTFVADGVKRLRMRSMRRRSRMWRSALLARRQSIKTSTPLHLQGAVSGGSPFADQVGYLGLLILRTDGIRVIQQNTPKHSLTSAGLVENAVKQVKEKVRRTNIAPNSEGSRTALRN